MNDEQNYGMEFYLLFQGFRSLRGGGGEKDAQC